MKQNVTIRLAKYIQANCISTQLVASETGIAEEKLQAGTTGTLTAAEFLELCAYLNVRPEEI